MGPSTEAPATGPDVAARDWLELFEPVRPLATTRFTRNIQCRGREGAAVVVREIRPAAHWHAGERALAIAALRREAEVLTALQGTPGAGSFPRLAAATVDGPAAWIAVEFLTGPTLRALFPSGLDGSVLPEQGWTLPQALRAVLSLRPGLAALHRLGLAHGGLHPGILVVEEDGGSDETGAKRLRIATLGWAGMPAGATLAPAVEALPYGSPRIFERAGAPDPSADAWSAAAVLFELVSGRAPFVGGGSRLRHEQRFAARRSASAAPPHLPPELPAEVARGFEIAFADGRAEAPTAAGEPLAEFFASVAHALEAARRDKVWRRARLPHPDIESIRARVKREAPQPSPDLLIRHDDLVRRYAGAASALAHGFETLAGRAEGPPWSAWKAEVARDAAAPGLHASDDPARQDAEALPRRLSEIEDRLARFQAIVAEALEVMRLPLQRLTADLDAVAVPRDEDLAARLRAHRGDAGRLAQDAPAAERFALAVRLLAEGDDIRVRVLRTRGEEAWNDVVRRGDWRAAMSLLDARPAEESAATENLRQRLLAWRKVAEPVERLLGAPRSAEGLRAIADLARSVGTSAPSGFEGPARDLARRLEAALEGARSAALEAVDKARAFARAQTAAAERAAERALMEDLPDRAGATLFCAALERLETEVEAIAGRLKAPGGLDLALECAARLEALRSEVGAARQAWWAREALPASKREWADYRSRVSALFERGARGNRQARRLLESPPVGWEEAARSLVKRLPAAPPEKPRRFMVPVAAGGVALAAVAVWFVLRGSDGGRPEPQPGDSRPSSQEPSKDTATPETRPKPPAQTGATSSRAWIYGPALGGLTLMLAQNGQDVARVALPGEVPFPPGAMLGLRLAWGDGSSKEGQVASADARAIQAEVNRLMSDVSGDSGRSGALDGQVARWAGRLLESGP